MWIWGNLVVIFKVSNLYLVDRVGKRGDLKFAEYEKERGERRDMGRGVGENSRGYLIFMISITYLSIYCMLSISKSFQWLKYET